MSPYPTIDELAGQIQPGRGTSIIVEGETEQDETIYNYWFGNLATQVFFFPQDGWPQVTRAVQEMRRRLPGVPCYGILDRDFTPENALDINFAHNGILRTRNYTIENYLLNPGCWADVFKLIFRRGSVPGGWDNPATISEYITQACRECLPLAAHNYVVHYVNEYYAAVAEQIPEGQRVYLHDPRALTQTDLVSRFQHWTGVLGSTEDLVNMFGAFQQDLAQANPDAWMQHISGKHVLKVLHQRFPLSGQSGRFRLSHYISLYLDKCHDPPPDLKDLVYRCLNHAHGK